MTAVFTTCRRCATIASVSLGIAGRHQMIVDFYCCAVNAHCASAITRATAASTFILIFDFN